MEIIELFCQEMLDFFGYELITGDKQVLLRNAAGCLLDLRELFQKRFLNKIRLRLRRLKHLS